MHLLWHENPEAYFVARTAKKITGDKQEEYWCEFPGCPKAKGGAQAYGFTSSSGYSQHVKGHKDPSTGKPWIPPRKRKTAITERITRVADSAAPYKVLSYI